MLGALLVKILRFLWQDVTLTFISTMTTTFAAVCHWTEHELALLHLGTKAMVLRVANFTFASVGVTSVFFAEIIVTLASTVAAHTRIFILVKDSSQARAFDLLAVLTIETPLASTERTFGFVR
jgi:hypothetical protein